MADGDSTSPSLSTEMFGAGTPDTGGTAPASSQLPVPQVTPQAPPIDQTGGGAPYSQDQIDQAKHYVETNIKAVEDAKKQADLDQQQVEQARQDYINSHHEADGEIPQPWGNMNQAPPQVQQAAIQTNSMWPAVVGLGLAIAGMAGKHGGVTQGYFLGGLMNGYAQGKQQQQKEMRDNWWKQVEYQHQINNERIAQYRAAMQDARLTEYQKAQVLATYSNNFKDSRMMLASAQGNLREAEKIVSDYQKANDRYLKEAHKTAGALEVLMKGSGKYKEYADAAYYQFTLKNGHPPMSEADQLQALKDLKFSDWAAEQTKYGPTSPSGQPTIVPKYPTMPSPTPSADQKQQNYDKSLNTSVDNMPDFMGGSD